MTEYPMTVNAQGVEIVDCSDGAWATYLAEGRDQLTRAEAAHAETTHQLDMSKAAGLHEVNNLRFDPAVIALANHIRIESPHPDKPGLDDIIEGIVAPYREEYLAGFDDTPAPVTTHRVGRNESAFLKLLGGK